MQIETPYLAALLVCFSVGRGMSEQVKCPRYCTCYVNTTSSLRSVACVAKRLDNIDLLIPKRLQSLDLSNNSISALEDRGFQNVGLFELHTLILKHNSIRSVSLHSFAGLPYLQWVDLSYNNLHIILPWTFHENSNLKFISLSGNPLGNLLLTGQILDVPSLQELELSHCNFGHLSEEAFSALPNLRRLDISRNQLVTWSSYPLQYLNNLKELDISRNPWPCDINLKNLKSFMRENAITLKESSCDLQSDVENVISNSKQVKFEKMISVRDYIETEIDSDSEDEGTKEEFDEIEQFQSGTDKCECKSEIENSSSTETSFILPRIWLAMVSFQLGVCVTLFMGYCCVYCCSGQKKRYHPLDQTVSVLPIAVAENQSPSSGTSSSSSSTETISCPDTPPPSYRELYIA